MKSLFSRRENALAKRRVEAPRKTEPSSKAPLLNTQKEAQRLMQLLQDSGGGAVGSDDRLRKLAAELVARVEGRQPRPKATLVPSEAAKEQPREDLKSRSAVPSKRQLQPPVQTPQRATPLPVTTPRRVTSEAPASTALARAAYQTRAKAITAEPVVAQLPPPDIAPLLAEGLRQNTIGGEHPAVIAAALKGQTRRKQAEALRRLPSGLVRSVQRLLF